mmetsp:Transcript_92271/g.270072  ORF Transcript_92271/g.270072 Transcript_92271/m.270072 type:complete len:92 (+) Transcript_92271:1010-1285(+)
MAGICSTLWVPWDLFWLQVTQAPIKLVAAETRGAIPSTWRRAFQASLALIEQVWLSLHMHIGLFYRPGRKTNPARFNCCRVKTNVQQTLDH